MNADDLDTYLRGLGLEVELAQDVNGEKYSVIKDVILAKGALAGRSCDVALARPTVQPYVTPPAIHTRPAMVPMTMTDPLKTQASALGPDWQYWSRRLDRPPTPQTIWTHILTVLGEVA
jgi:hypothetical protein